MVLSNWEQIYDCAVNEGLPVITLFQICTMVAEQPPICQSFLRLLVDQLETVPIANRDPFLVGAISNIIELQPNAAGNLWCNVL